MKKTNFILLLLSCVFAFTGCSDNDDETDVPKPEMKYKQVKQILFYEGNDAGKTTVFHYDDKGRIIEKINADQRWTYTYNGNQIIKRNGQEIEETFTLGEDGKVIKIESAIEGEIYTFSYSGERIQKIVEKYPEAEYSGSESYFWNGNLNRTTYTDDEGSSETVYEYADLKYINNANIDLFAYIGDFYNYAEDALMLGIAGERSWYLPTKLTTTDKEDGETDTYTYRYSYVQDDEGYITRITEEGNEGTNVYEITYND